MDTYGVSTTTAQSAFRELRSDGLTYSVQGRGTFVRDGAAGDVVVDDEPSPDYQALLEHITAISDQIESLEERLSVIERERRAGP